MYYLICVPLFMVLAIGNANVFQSLDHLRPSASSQTQQQAAAALINRLIPERAHSFVVSVNPAIGPVNYNTFQLSKNESSEVVTILGTSGVAVAWGFHYYLKYYCDCHVSWDSDQLKLPLNLPPVAFTFTSADRFRYYQNVCTTSYSFVWWTWQRWQREIDWMALNGFNLVLAFNGQEAIWQRVYRKLNLTYSDIDQHFTGPAFFSWSRMGNMRGWGGPLSTYWHESSLSLQHSILARMRELGIIPVLPGFAGHVPRAFKRIFPNASMTMMGSWNGFQDDYCCPYLLEPTEPLFQTVGQLYMKEMIGEFSTDHVYNCDTFNEMSPRTGNVKYLAGVGKAVFRAMTDVDPQAIWVLQAWLFVHDMIFWQKRQAQAFLTSVPQGKMIVLDLQSELLPQYERMDSYFGQPFIWCMLHNFGGTLGLYGSVDNVNEGVFSGRRMANSTMIGTGLTPEGIHQNYAVYELMNDMAYRTEPANLTAWFREYATRRYGGDSAEANQAWQLLKGSVYNFTGVQRVRGKYIICRRPSLKLRPLLWYNASVMNTAWTHLLSASSQLNRSANYQHDLVDVTRQALQLIAAAQYALFVNAFKERIADKFQKHADLFLDVLKELEVLLASNKDFLLGNWLNAAKNKAYSQQERTQFEMNARNQITLWGPQGEIRDYANKQWSGVVGSYFLPRWQLFISALNVSLITGSKFNESAVGARIFSEVELPFTLDQTEFPDKPQGDSVLIATKLHTFWTNQTRVWNSLERFQLQPQSFNTNSNQKRSLPSDVWPSVIMV